MATIWQRVDDLNTLKRGDFLRVETPQHVIPATDDDRMRVLLEAAYEGQLIVVQWDSHIDLFGHHTIFTTTRPTIVYRRMSK